jgi:hypothetical protein
MLKRRRGASSRPAAHSHYAPLALSAAPLPSLSPSVRPPVLSTSSVLSLSSDPLLLFDEQFPDESELALEIERFQQNKLLQTSEIQNHSTQGSSLEFSSAVDVSAPTSAPIMVLDSASLPSSSHAISSSPSFPAPLLTLEEFPSLSYFYAEVPFDPSIGSSALEESDLFDENEFQRQLEAARSPKRRRSDQSDEDEPTQILPPDPSPFQMDKSTGENSTVRVESEGKNKKTSSFTKL